MNLPKFTLSKDGANGDWVLKEGEHPERGVDSKPRTKRRPAVF